MATPKVAFYDLNYQFSPAPSWILKAHTQVKKFQSLKLCYIGLL